MPATSKKAIKNKKSKRNLARRMMTQKRTLAKPYVQRAIQKRVDEAVFAKTVEEGGEVVKKLLKRVEKAEGDARKSASQYESKKVGSSIQQTSRPTKDRPRDQTDPQKNQRNEPRKEHHRTNKETTNRGARNQPKTNRSRRQDST